MSTIQQAAKRLEELRRAGVAIPWETESIEDKAIIAAAQTDGVPAPVLPVATDTRAPVAPRVRVPTGRQSELVNLDLVNLAQQGYLVPGHENNQLSEEFRAIKRPLIRNAQGKGAAPVHHANLIVVTSALPGEGKTFFSMNLALSIAMELDASALLVEADILKPAVMSRLGMPPRRGLLDVLTDEKIDPSDVMLRTNVPKFSLLPAGSKMVHTTELLASTRMGEFLDELATRYADRIIVFDAPPLLMTSEAQVLASRAGQVVVLAEAGRTPAAAFSQAMTKIEACPVVMIALNKSKESHHGVVYGYGGDSMYSEMQGAA
ncbi:XrtA-associated tyrosine autokinase [Rhizobacter sp. Root1221]|uniref:XrtA-associated tyrosine autokinase n=1 Tax=Rhizobacter sp. Root1221 TaxID=1736433 RepID=UPI0009EA9908|nr:XrtA-associated tyrosine autokinase [Rhizobacter sp. Root1221]